MVSEKPKPFKVQRGFVFARDLQEQNEGRDRLSYRKLANALQNKLILGEDFVAWLKEEIHRYHIIMKWDVEDELLKVLGALEEK